MKNKTRLILLAIVASLLVPVYLVSAAAVRVRVTWDEPDPTTPPPSGYLLYKKDSADWTMVRRHDSVVRDLEITDLGGGEYRLTAYNAGGESAPSDVFVIPGRPGSPLGARVILEIR